ncbi:hypothetical protein F511_09441 [Dorcoceras hygrometricum]|uniref:Uncharacterized protein n=1 Tax=Dorcoceras hygrometricum TaxID=472368 RepID=A0A2Z7BHN3_9LAMI|nr:hypothetical protein F511_09441 [Dorcoceras hygrometricum]
MFDRKSPSLCKQRTRRLGCDGDGVIHGRGFTIMKAGGGSDSLASTVVGWAKGVDDEGETRRRWWMRLGSGLDDDSMLQWCRTEARRQDWLRAYNNLPPYAEFTITDSCLRISSSSSSSFTSSTINPSELVYPELYMELLQPRDAVKGPGGRWRRLVMVEDVYMERGEAFLFAAFPFNLWRVPRGKDLSVLMANRGSDRISSENSSDEGESKIRLSSLNSLDPPTTHIHDERIELENSHEGESDENACNLRSVPLTFLSASDGPWFIYIFNLGHIVSSCLASILLEAPESQTFCMFETVGVGCPLRGARALVKSKFGGMQHALQLECGSLWLFDETIDPRLLLPAEKKIELAEVRDLHNEAGHHSVKAPWVRPPRKRVVPNSRDAPQRMGSPRLTDIRSSPQPRQYHITVGKSTNDRRKDLGPKYGDVPWQSGDDDAQKSLNERSEVETGAHHNVSGGGHIFVEGVNHRDRAGSLGSERPEFGWNMGKTLIRDHGVLHLLPQPIESLTHALAWNAFQTREGAFRAGFFNVFPDCVVDDYIIEAFRPVRQLTPGALSLFPSWFPSQLVSSFTKAVFLLHVIIGVDIVHLSHKHPA